MRILATSDVHSPKHLSEFKNSLVNVSNVDLALLAGDMVDGGRIEYYSVIINLLRNRAGAIIAVPGNEEYDDKLRALKGMSGLTLLNDEALIINGVKIIGSRGILDKPTKWQERNIKGIDELYRRRLGWLINELKNSNEVILLTHYAPVYATLEGENEYNYPLLGTRKLEEVLSSSRVLAIHGHAHRSKTRCVKMGDSVIINAAFENVASPFIIDYSDGGINVIEPREYSRCKEVSAHNKTSTLKSTGLDEWLK
ncbi:metallophosphoesterase family protein [Caldivirga maquilingensis]|uniref:Metallophosphoesterase n=1 Tax=Caldivirga maquilingensis (strain ATCC 700844 / DSM 13496 / JCM 10307 / IC-167) TaxID=397948 RepID=A8MCZ4_CALMQ|nr:metallophosphoesterase [Caldivirga maquilingensis]ABW01650.1 metallophosphoesterase [Caldivirga maquilingensis IC-167]